METPAHNDLVRKAPASASGSEQEPEPGTCLAAKETAADMPLSDFAGALPLCSVFRLHLSPVSDMISAGGGLHDANSGADFSGRPFLPYGSFKPLLPLCGKTFIGHIIETFRAADIDPIVVVTGHEASRLRDALKETGALFLHNERYAETDMFASVCIGLKYLMGRCDRVLLTPADVPLFSLETVRRLLKTEAPLACPAHIGAAGHPLMIDCALFPEITAFAGEGGCRRISAAVKSPFLF